MFVRLFILSFSALMLLASGCSTTVDRTPNTSTQGAATQTPTHDQAADIADEAPVSMSTRKPLAGTIAYNPDGLETVVNMRRKSALNKIVRACGSHKYEIVREEVRPVDQKHHAKRGEARGLATFGASRLKYIDYRCID